MPTFRFRPGKDEELKKWYESLPEGERSREIRKILKYHINNNIEECKPEVEVKKNNKKKDHNNTDNKIDNLMNQF